MKMGKDSRTGLNRYFASSKSQDDPSTGVFTYRVSPYAPPLQFLLWKGDTMQFRTGPWNGADFSGMSRRNNVLNMKLVVDQEEMYYDYAPGTQRIITRSVLSYSDEVQQYLWNSSSLEWLVIYTLLNDPCDHYGHCGVNSICTISEPLICSCSTGHMPKSPQDWEIQIWSGGCIRKHPLNCSKGEDFLEIKDVKVPDQWPYWVNSGVTLKERKAECLKNCSCTGYANSNFSGKGRDSLPWYGDLIDIRRLPVPTNQNLYVRLAATDIELLTRSRNKKLVILVVVAFSAALSVIFWRAVS